MRFFFFLDIYKYDMDNYFLSSLQDGKDKTALIHADKADVCFRHYLQGGKKKLICNTNAFFSSF